MTEPALSAEETHTLIDYSRRKFAGERRPMSAERPVTNHRSLVSAHRHRYSRSGHARCECWQQLRLGQHQHAIGDENGRRNPGCGSPPGQCLLGVSSCPSVGDPREHTILPAIPTLNTYVKLTIGPGYSMRLWVVQTRWGVLLVATDIFSFAHWATVSDNEWNFWVGDFTGDGRFDMVGYAPATTPCGVVKAPGPALILALNPGQLYPTMSGGFGSATSPATAALTWSATPPATKPCGLA